MINKIFLFIFCLFSCFLQASPIEKAIDSYGNETTYHYDASGRLVEIGLPAVLDEYDQVIHPSLRLECDYTYDQLMQKREWPGAGKIEEKGTQENIQQISVDTQDILSPLFKQAHVVNNELGQFVKLEEVVDEKGIKALTTYDALQRPVSFVMLNARGEKISEQHIRYQANGQKALEKHIIFCKGKERGSYLIRWRYDHLNRLIAIQEAADSPFQKTTHYSYNAAGLLESVTKPNGTLLTYTYHDNQLLAAFSASDGSFSYAYKYDDHHRLVAIEDRLHGITQKRCYNDLDELIEEHQGSMKLLYEYDLKGRRTSVTLPDASHIVYHYEGSLVTSIERLSPPYKPIYEHRYHYDPVSGQLVKSDLIKNLGSISYRYHSQGQLLAIDSPWWSQQAEEKDLDAKGRFESLNVKDPMGSLTSTYTYADDGQLLEEQGAVHKRYQYDSLYNRLGEDEQEWTVNALNQLLQTPEFACDYDLNGNVSKKTSQSATLLYEYDALNRLTRIVKPECFALTYIYDTFDRRILQRFSQWDADRHMWTEPQITHFLYDGHKEIGKLNDQGQIIELRILGLGKGAEAGAAIALELNGQIFAPIHDHQGSIRCLVDEKGEVAEFYRYSAFGLESIYDATGELLQESRLGNPWRFCSKRLDDQTGLISFGKRHYDPQMGRWISPDPLYFYDTANLYAFVRNDSINHYDLYGLFSVSDVWSSFSHFFFECVNYLHTSAKNFKNRLNAELKLPELLGTALERMSKQLLGDGTYLLMGHSYEKTEVGCYGTKHISDKVRVTFINGILTTQESMLENLDIISQSHGGIKVHYIFRPTEGWTWDVCRGFMVRCAYYLGFRSMHAHLLASQWRTLIQEMGGVEGGGTIIHYAHSLGGSETDRARDLLTPEEQRMIRVVTFGSSTLISNGGFQKVMNIVSINDGVTTLLEPFGHVRNFFDPNTNVKFYKNFYFFIPFADGWPTDHFFTGPTYSILIRELGEQFLAEFGI